MPQLDTRASEAVDEAAALILRKFHYWFPYTFPFRFALAIGQRVSFRDVPLIRPVLDIGVNDGSTASLIHHGKSRIDWGGDMPEESTHESHGLYVSPDFNIYDNLIGMDACDIPFPDNSFNTIVCTEVFFYGMDRGRLLSEIVRVLAPGGTLAFSESSPEILNYPGIAGELRKDVPTFNVPHNPREYYHDALTNLGMQDFFFRPYFDGSLAALTLYLMYAWPPDANRGAYVRLIQDDPRYRTLYREGLTAIAATLRNEFQHPAGPENGWNVFVSCRKPGNLNPGAPTPHPVCLSCRSAELDRSLHACRCRSCGRDYPTRFGKPFLLRDHGTAYSPKPAGTSVDWTEKMESTIASALGTFRQRAAKRLGSPARIIVVGIDPSTEFTVKHLQEQGIEVDSVCSEHLRYVGERIGDARIIGLRDLGGARLPLLLSGYASWRSSFAGLVRTIRRAGYRGPVFSIGRGRVRKCPSLRSWANTFSKRSGMA